MQTVQGIRFRSWPFGTIDERGGVLLKSLFDDAVLNAVKADHDEPSAWL
jgi:hypothetical protein